MPDQSVAARACGLAPVLGADANLLEAAAYCTASAMPPALPSWACTSSTAPGTCATPQHADALLCRLVAHHSGAIIEAGERGLADVLNAEFEPELDALASVLTCCDMTSPDGEPVPSGQRLAEIRDRYGPGHLMSPSMKRATPMILGAVKQVRRRAAHIA
jgi:hypothetical protein